MSLRAFALIVALCAAVPVAAQDVAILGEVHDNPVHHRVQAEHVADLAPAALIFEMLTPDQIDGNILPEFRHPDGLSQFLEWDSSGWPDFSLYAPIFAAAPGAQIYGAGVPRDQARQVLSQGLTEGFGPQAARFGLDQPLPKDQQVAREALQMSAHCDALPEELLPGMVAVQRLRDAVMARAVIRALDKTGGPVAVITGNGHARRDWGVPAVLAEVAPDLDIWVLGQTEDDRPLEGGFDAVKSAPKVDRPDPCAAFQ